MSKDHLVYTCAARHRVLDRNCMFTQWLLLTCKYITTACRRAAKAIGRDDPDLIAEQLSRNTLFLGDEGQRALRGSFVVVVGLGGVGSHAAHMLARECAVLGSCRARVDGWGGLRTRVHLS